MNNALPIIEHAADAASADTATQSGDAPIAAARVCFLLSILPRSGTNYVYNLLAKHPHCLTPGPIWEDSFVRHSDLLMQYVQAVTRRWTPDWQTREKVGPPETLLPYFGEAIKQILQLQVTQNAEIQAELRQQSAAQRRANVLITKTPHTESIENFFELLPTDHLLVIVRDGRAVIESGMRSFGWNYEKSTRRWAQNAAALLNLQRTCAGSDKKLLIVKYEDFLTDQTAMLRKVFDFLNLDATWYDYDEVRNFRVIGSSDTKQDGEVHWEAVDRYDSFDPLNRFGHWTLEQHRLFNRLAGRYLTELGYALVETGED
ncbi:MAG: sulfotransferase [Leptolyngbya sp. SIO4C1]|nr:sulfotransferase [Leptolyngbya sp. SIO4C1]